MDPSLRRLIENALPDLSNDEVAHYTAIRNLLHFFPEGSKSWSSARATPLQFLNDRRELTLGLEILLEVAKSTLIKTDTRRMHLEYMIEAHGSVETDVFQMSFSRNVDDLGQWRGYTSESKGCSVVTGSKSLRSMADLAGWVIYDDATHKSFADVVLRSLSKFADRRTLHQVLSGAASFMKHRGFESESEFRVLFFPSSNKVKIRDTGERIVPYIDFLSNTAGLPVSRIMIGPGWQLSRLTPEEKKQNHVVQGVHRLLELRGLDNDVDIECSEIPFDPH